MKPLVTAARPAMKPLVTAARPAMKPLVTAARPAHFAKALKHGFVVYC